ncbi:MAG: bacteriohopanetetrol glucosamine biosynthesis glycosyltransferase HpnI [Nitrospira sp.]|nr:bacteriohopanetetrol glucosamine biosynthesis glycosyltransferase HpnI [Nitrospira sp.]
MTIFSILATLCLIPVIFGSVYALLCMVTGWHFSTSHSTDSQKTFSKWPAVTILKPICGLEKNLRTNLRTTCEQDYPILQVVLSVQSPNDPAIPLLYEIQREFGRKRVTVAIEDCPAGPNPKINNLIGGLKHARHDLLIISDSDIQLRPDYVKTIIGPLADPEVGFVCTLYKGIQARTWWEKMELLTINTELIPNMMFALVTGASQFCVGASTALRRSTLNDIGGLPSLANYLVEDYEMGRRIWMKGQRMVILPYLVETVIDLPTPRKWWHHLIRWDQCQRAARPLALLSTILIKPIPFACFYALFSLGTTSGLLVVALTVAIRLLTAGIILRWNLQDREGLFSLWLLPFRDIAALVSWGLAFTKETTVWRHSTCILTTQGHLVDTVKTEQVDASFPFTGKGASTQVIPVKNEKPDDHSSTYSFHTPISHLSSSRQQNAKEPFREHHARNTTSFEGTQLHTGEVEGNSGKLPKESSILQYSPVNIWNIKGTS